jgi:hypothetical protein
VNERPPFNTVALTIGKELLAKITCFRFPANVFGQFATITYWLQFNVLKFNTIKRAKKCGRVCIVSLAQANIRGRGQNSLPKALGNS